MFMPMPNFALSAAALAISLMAVPALAASSAASSASDSLTTSVGSVSNSFTGASGSSKTAVAAAGDYQLIQVAAAPNRPGVLQLTLRPVAAKEGQGAAEDLLLSLPQKAFDSSGLAQGQVVAARAHAYGLEFANAQTRAAFFLVLSDAAYRELASHPVAL
jgi:hypothetical protein